MFTLTPKTKEEIESLLEVKREYIKNNPEYFGIGTPSKKKDYIAYKKQLYSSFIK